jgi:hypothetical protein
MDVSGPPDPAVPTDSAPATDTALPAESAAETALALAPVDPPSDDRFAVAPFEQPRPLEHYGAGLRPITMPPLLQMLEVKKGSVLSLE